MRLGEGADGSPWAAPSAAAWNQSRGRPGGPNGSRPLDGRDEEVAKVEIALLGLTFGLAVVGNGLVLLALRRAKASRVHLFMGHLSLADLAVAFFQVLPQLCWEVTFRFHGPDGLCRVVKHLQVFGMFASAYLLVALTADRYIAVCHPLKTLQRPARRSRAMIAAAWALSFLLSLPQAFIFSLREVESGSRVYDCWAAFVQPWGARAYITWITGGIFVAPVAVLATCYAFICRRIWSKGRRGAARPGGLLRLAPAATSARHLSRAKIRTVKMTLVIVSAYVLCWAPFFTVQMWSVWDWRWHAAWTESEDIVITVTALLASLNSCCNPWIYMFFSGHLLQDFIQSFPCCRKLKQTLNKEDSESISRRQTSFTNNKSPTNSLETWRESPNSSKSMKFIPISS